MNTRGLTTYFSVLIRPRAAFATLKERPTWGWAAVAGIAMTLVAVIVAEPAQLHMLGVSEVHRLAALPPSERLQERIAFAQVAGMRQSLFIVGALTVPWISWFLIAVFFIIAARASGSRAGFKAAWVATLNSYVVYGLATALNAVLVALRDPASINSPLDLVRLPSLASLVPHDPAVAAFLSAYNPLNVWYFAVAAVALEQLLAMPRVASVVTAIVCSALFGFFNTASVRGGP